MMSTASVLLAAAQVGPDPDDVTPGLLGFLVVAALGLAIWFLLRSMTRHLKKVDFETKDALPRAGTGRTSRPTEDDRS
jgi:hypothetical protein